VPTSDNKPYTLPETRIHPRHQACQITFSLTALSAKRRNSSAFDHGYAESLGIIKGDLVEQIRKKASEATIHAFQQEGQGCRYRFRVMCRFKNLMHPQAVSRIFTSAIQMQTAFRISPSTWIKVCQTSLEAVRQSYVLQPPEKGERWLHHSLFCSKAHDMPLPEFVQELGKTVRREEGTLLGCVSWEQYKNQAWAMQALLYSIHEVLLTKCTSLDVGTAAVLVAAPPRHPSNAEASTTPDEPDGIQNSTDTIDATAATSPRENDGISRRLTYPATPRPDAHAPVETPEPQRQRPSGDSQALDTITTTSRMGGSRGIIATQFCFGCSEADLHFEAGPAVSGADAGPSASNRPATSSRVCLRASDLSAISQQLAFS
jgi:hypothetical protein